MCVVSVKSPSPLHVFRPCVCVCVCPLHPSHVHPACISISSFCFSQHASRRRANGKPARRHLDFVSCDGEMDRATVSVHGLACYRCACVRACVYVCTPHMCVFSGTTHCHATELNSQNSQNYDLNNDNGPQ